MHRASPSEPANAHTRDSALLSAAAPQGLYAPSRSCSNERAEVGAYLNATSNSMAAMLQMAGQALNNATLVQQGQVRRRSIRLQPMLLAGLGQPGACQARP